jgi:putative FmdB family regulatory protein
MPNYDYICDECAHSFAIRHPYKYEGTVCLKCGSEEIKKDLSKPIQHSVKPLREVVEKAGSQVNHAIRDNQAELAKTQKEISKRVYKK